ncbi:MAG TPA: alpha/beta hydrolase [Candidatus Nitrosocosmicus sp.]|nr:alpha/beta hydrolase [Candidatus Nitrosocosmicus sp.]
MKENKVKLNDFHIRYLKSEKHNSSKKKNILFIHGLGSSSDRWLDIPDALSRYFHPIVAVDLIGFGGSDKPVTIEYTIEYFSKFIRDVITCKQIWRNDDNGSDDSYKTIIIGHSLGGYIAAKVAIKDQDLIEKLVLIDSSGMLKKPTSLLDQYLNAALNPSFENVKSVFEQMLGNPTLLSPTLVNAFIKRINLVGAKYAFKSAFENSTKKHIESSELQSIENIPSLIIWGAADRLIPVTHAKRFNKILKNSTLQIIENTGHAPFAEKPSMVFDIIRTFLTNNK